MFRAIAGGMLLVVTAGCGGILPHESNVDSSKFDTYEHVLASYDGIKPGVTHAAELPALGFDTQTAPNIEVLSYTEIIDRFLPSETAMLRHAPEPVRRCVEAESRCSAYVFHLQNSHKHHSGSVVPDLLGFERDTVNEGWTADITLLIEDDLVVYKVISGRPRIEEQHETTQPLGPLQNVGKGLGAPEHE